MQKGIAPYPYQFDPTFHRYRLGEPAAMEKGQRIFVCSMADLFGDWTPDEWLEDVFDACQRAPQHQYLFLTKNPSRYRPDSTPFEYSPSIPNDDNFWFGTTINRQDDVKRVRDLPIKNRLVSIEPIMEDIDFVGFRPSWIIVGAESGNRKGRIVPDRKWINNIKWYCVHNDIPLFMKNSLAPIWSEPLIQEFPKGLEP